MDGGAPTPRQRVAAYVRELDERHPAASTGGYDAQLVRERLHQERLSPRLVDRVNIVDGEPGMPENRFDRILVAAAAQRQHCKLNRLPLSPGRMGAGDRFDDATKTAICKVLRSPETLVVEFKSRYCHGATPEESPE